MSAPKRAIDVKDARPTLVKNFVSSFLKSREVSSLVKSIIA
jgi:hypothetical protein